MRYISHMCVMEPVTYDLDIKLTCIIRYIVEYYILIYADTLFKILEHRIIIYICDLKEKC